ncbi:MAG: CDGSH iron-sulfur domain-containing protein [Armatimonadota bacterium]|nr:CDGSH iron-sulfur domain-containing protein [bacterium]MDW8104269.1 CDGSH iron-sulfur domain-containing protein [Armatimonadota bacterium]MDW8290035.1 CDGSH iron-sulfur domain-containing protein [Armatimonadota bacterium]
MAKHSTEEIDGRPRTTVELEPGERVALCRCFKSNKFPFCDGTHRQYQGVGPVIVQAPGEKQTSP